MRLRKTKLYNLKHFISSLFIGQTRASRSGPCILVACHDTNRYQQNNGKWFSPILEPMAEYYRASGMRIVHLSYPTTIDGVHDVYGDFAHINWPFFYTHIIRKIELLVLTKSVAEERAHHRLVLVYKKLLRSISPQLILSISTPAEIANAAHDLKVTLIEALHGMNATLVDELFAAKFACEDVRLPNAFLAFDAESLATVSSILKKRPIRSILMPHPWHVEVTRAHSALVQDVSRFETFLKKYEAVILVTLQWGYDGERDDLVNIIPNGIVHPSIEAAIATSPDNILWLVRLHPIQMKDRAYNRHREYVAQLSHRLPNVEVDMASTLPLPLLLSRCCGHVSMMSGVCGEAALMGVPSLMLCPTLKPGGCLEGMFSELSPKFVTYGDLTPAKIQSWVIEQADRSTPIRERGVDAQHCFERQLDRLREGRLE